MGAVEVFCFVEQNFNIVYHAMLLISLLADEMSFFSPPPEDLMEFHCQQTHGIRWSYLSFAKIRSSAFLEGVIIGERIKC